MTPKEENRSGEGGLCFGCTQGVMCEAADVYQYQPMHVTWCHWFSQGKMFPWKVEDDSCEPFFDFKRTHTGTRY